MGGWWRPGVPTSTGSVLLWPRYLAPPASRNYRTGDTERQDRDHRQPLLERVADAHYYYRPESEQPGEPGDIRCHVHRRRMWSQQQGKPDTHAYHRATDENCERKRVQTEEGDSGGHESGYHPKEDWQVQGYPPVNGVRLATTELTLRAGLSLQECRLKPGNVHASDTAAAAITIRRTGLVRLLRPDAALAGGYYPAACHPVGQLLLPRQDEVPHGYVAAFLDPECHRVFPAMPHYEQRPALNMPTRMSAAGWASSSAVAVPLSAASDARRFEKPAVNPIYSEASTASAALHMWSRPHSGQASRVNRPSNAVSSWALSACWPVGTRSSVNGHTTGIGGMATLPPWATCWRPLTHSLPRVTNTGRLRR